MARRFGVVVLVLVAAAFTLTYVVLQRSNAPHRASEVVTIIEHGAISQPEAHRGDYNEDAFALLPDPLPAAQACPAQQADTVMGSTLELVLASGEHLEYGGCPHQSYDTSLPAEFWPVWCRLIDAPLPAPGPSSCGDS